MFVSPTLDAPPGEPSSIKNSEYKRLIQASYNSQVNNYKSDNQNDVANKRGTLRYFYAP